MRNDLSQTSFENYRCNLAGSQIGFKSSARRLVSNLKQNEISFYMFEFVLNSNVQPLEWVSTSRTFDLSFTTGMIHFPIFEIMISEMQFCVSVRENLLIFPLFFDECRFSVYYNH